MFEKQEIEKFLDEYIGVGIKHLIHEERLFFYYGFLKNITDNEIKIETRTGFRVIPFSEILDIHIVPGAKP